MGNCRSEPTKLCFKRLNWIQQQMYTSNEYTLGHSEETIQIASREENRLATLHMTQQSSRTLEILSRGLTPEVYDTTEYIEAVKQLILRNHRSRIRILSFDSNNIVSRGHRLINLAMDLSSFIECRIPGNEYNNYNQEIFIADSIGYIHRLNAERYDGKLSFNDHRMVHHLEGDFEEIWDRSMPNPNFRRLAL